MESEATLRWHYLLVVQVAEWVQCLVTAADLHQTTITNIINIP